MEMTYGSPFKPMRSCVSISQYCRMTVTSCIILTRPCISRLPKRFFLSLQLIGMLIVILKLFVMLIVVLFVVFSVLLTVKSPVVAPRAGATVTVIFSLGAVPPAIFFSLAGARHFPCALCLDFAVRSLKVLPQVTQLGCLPRSAQGVFDFRCCSSF